MEEGDRDASRTLTGRFCWWSLTSYQSGDNEPSKEADSSLLIPEVKGTQFKRLLTNKTGS